MEVARDTLLPGIRHDTDLKTKFIRSCNIAAEDDQLPNWTLYLNDGLEEGEHCGQARPGSGVAAVDDKLRSVMGMQTKAAASGELPATASAGGGKVSGQLPLPPPQLINRWTVSADVAACTWLSAQRLTVLVPLETNGSALLLTSETGTSDS